MSSLPQPNPSVMALQPYQPGTPIAEVARQLGFDEDTISKLASNENPRGPSPAAVEAITRATQQLRLYPDSHDLTHALAGHHSMGADHIVIGNGSNDILDLVARTFLAPGDEAVQYEHSFLIYRLVTTAVGATPVVTKAANYAYDLSAMQAAITDKTRVIWIDNPNNPTGTFIQHDRLKEFLYAVPSHVLVVLDEAYWDYLPDDLRTDTAAWVNEFANLIVVRTFSKIHGLAALRVGYGITSPAIAEALNRIRQPFNVSSLALATAKASLGDGDFVKSERDANAAARQKLQQGLEELGCETLPSLTNFVTAKFDDSQAVQKYLLQRGIIVRPVANYGLEDFLRITVGTDAEITALLQALSDYKSEEA